MRTAHEKREAFTGGHHARASCRLSPRHSGDLCLGRRRPCIWPPRPRPARRTSIPAFSRPPRSAATIRSPISPKASRCQGKREIAFTWKGVTWRFATQRTATIQGQARGLRAAVRRLLRLGGVARIHRQGRPRYWKVVDGKLYLNYNAGVQKDWEKDVPGNIAKATRTGRRCSTSSNSEAQVSGPYPQSLPPISPMSGVTLDSRRPTRLFAA